MQQPGVSCPHLPSSPASPPQAGPLALRRLLPTGPLHTAPRSQRDNKPFPGACCLGHPPGSPQSHQYQGENPGVLAPRPHPAFAAEQSGGGTQKSSAQPSPSPQIKAVVLPGSASGYKWWLCRAAAGLSSCFLLLCQQHGCPRGAQALPGRELILGKPSRKRPQIWTSNTTWDPHEAQRFSHQANFTGTVNDQEDTDCGGRFSHICYREFSCQGAGTAGDKTGLGSGPAWHCLRISAHKYQL
nr:uncharacterized protein LOC116815742 [Chelonoidis abingdonii]